MNLSILMASAVKSLRVKFALDAFVVDEALA
jgi:hypothetical protein